MSGSNGGRDCEEELEEFGKTGTDMSDVMKRSGSALGSPLERRVIETEIYSTPGKGNERSW